MELQQFPAGLSEQVCLVLPVPHIINLLSKKNDGMITPTPHVHEWKTEVVMCYCIWSPPPAILSHCNRAGVDSHYSVRVGYVSSFLYLSLRNYQSISEGSITISLMWTENKTSDRTILCSILRCLRRSWKGRLTAVSWCDKPLSELLFQQSSLDSITDTRGIHRISFLPYCMWK